MGCGEFIVKYILFFTNLFFALAGLALVGVGIAVQLQVSVIVENIEDANFQVAPITTIVVGSIVFLISFYGCCGAIKESNCMLVTYSILMILLMIAKIILAVLIFVKLDDLVDEVPRQLGDFFNRNPLEFQELEKAFNCCGPTGAISYGIKPLPASCCAEPPCNLLNAHGGCNGKVQELLDTYGIAIGAVAIVVAAIELVAVVFGLCLANHARNKSRRTRY